VIDLENNNKKRIMKFLKKIKKKIQKKKKTQSGNKIDF